MKISVIVPVYNVQDYLDQCLTSIREQTYSDLEILLVNDGSTDRSGHICDTFAELDSRIRVIHQPNGGVSSARNTGIKEATGDFITFVDSDDWLDAGMYQMMIEPALENQELQVLLCDFSTVQNGNFTNITSDLREGYFTKSDIIRDIYPTLLVTENFGRIPVVSVWSCLFKKSLLRANNIKFDVSLRYSEDYLFMAMVMIHCDSFFYLKEQYYYYYRQYDDSRSKKYQPEWWSNLLSLNSKLKHLLQDYKEYDFSRQVELQLIHSALFVSNAIYTSTTISKQRKSALLRDLFNGSAVRVAFTSVTFKNQPLTLKAVLYLIKWRMSDAYLVYRNLVSAIKK